MKKNTDHGRVDRNLIAEMMESRLSAARAGDSDAAKWAIKEFAATVQNFRDAKGRPHRVPSGCGTQFDERLLDYFAACFGRLLAGKEVKGGRPVRVTADQALNLSKPGVRGRKASDTTRQESLVRGLEVWEIYKAATKKKNLPAADGRTLSPSLSDAIKQVAKGHKKGIETIRHDYMAWRSLFKGFSANPGN